MPSISKKQMQEYEQYLKDRNAGRIITPDGLKLICASFDNNPQQIGAHFLSVLTKFRNEGVFEHRFVECVFFWLDNEENGYLSNWYNRSFSVNGISYSNTEQYFMAQKAIVFGDNATLKLIMKARSPKECKQLGRNVSPFDSAVWDTKSYEIMKTGNRAKFLQNTDLMNKLLSTGNAILAEASPIDGIWGIKLSAEQAEDIEPAKWPGKNLQGKLLMELREEFRAAAIE